ncbi:nicotinate-nucleotide adenylyltransferase [SAR92 clade bacterium H455]|uniref:Probable nicotinate-nucleotide adenylyltransferase n=1 Tax=SAR92 clade bacterium H455 TaxID=2974818 RepID=A0ABY5TT48_9GAMM|nr:nicotinate-nucleotide adenylyltransferase [SAR92 clade bacterium H455]
MATGRFVNNMSVAIFGGTFNPVHFGHLRIAIELVELLGVDSLHMTPCSLPPHREALTVSAEQRMAMLQIALADYPQLVADDIELRRGGTTYTIDTLRQIRQQIGNDTPLYLCVGVDVLITLESWQEWQQLRDYCHLVISARPGYELPTSGALANWINQHRCDDLPQLKQCSAGKLYFCDTTRLAISSTQIRDKIKHGDAIDFLTPAAVVNYIHQYDLYE